MSPADHVVESGPHLYPPAERTRIVDDLHGFQVPDPYRWLEDATSPATTTWLAAQDALTDSARGQWPLREHFSRRIRDLLAAGSTGVPIWRGERYFFVRREGDQEHGALMLAETGGTPSTRVLLDPTTLDPSGLTTLDGWQPSRDGALLAYQLSEGGTEESVLRVLDTATGALIDGPIDRARYSPVAWLPDGTGFYYVRRLAPDLVPDDEHQYHRRVYLHRLGTDPSLDAEIFGAGHDLRSYFGVSLSRDGRWLLISSATGTAPRNDLWIADLEAEGSSAQAPTMRGVALGLDARVDAHVGRDGRLYIGTDLDAPRGRLAVTDPGDPGPETWVDLIAEDPEAVLEDYTILDGPAIAQAPVLLAGWTRHGVSEVSVHDLRTGVRREGAEGAVSLPGIGTVGALIARPEGGHEAWFSYTDHSSPPHIYRWDALTSQTRLFAAPPGQVAVPAVTTRQEMFTSADGTLVRLFVIARDDASLPAPAMLYGYGGFGLALNPGFSATALAWVEAGGVYAIANLRGGSEEGEQWHRDGMLEHKQNVFDDFHGAAEHLVRAGWTTPEQLSISGGSNGGLLVGAALTQRPDLYAAVVCTAPLLDMVRYEHFGLGATWNVEYGSAADPDQLAVLLAYSPYHQVRAGVHYPATLFSIFDADSRVDPLHARKMCAALQYATTHDGAGEHAGLSDAAGRGPILLRREADVGHSARSLSRTIAASADALAFAAHHTGLTGS